jgi:hypothetical protein
MRRWRNQRGRRYHGVALAILALSLLAPLDAVALDSDLKGSAVFRLKASHGYTILGFATSERLDGRGDIGLIVYRRGTTVFYSAPATVTPTKLDADLGALGKFSAEIVPSGKEKRLRSRCDDEVNTAEPDVYHGRLEFHGEQGYTNVVATDVPEYPQFFLDFHCPGGGVTMEVGGRGLPGARLRAFSGRHDSQLLLQLNKNRPHSPMLFEATLKEARDGIRIDRTVSGRQPAAAFEYDPLLRTATVQPSAPFSGVGSFRRGAAVANRWTGTLSVDFPGKANVPLTGGAFSVHAVHARRTG